MKATRRSSSTSTIASSRVASRSPRGATRFTTSRFARPSSACIARVRRASGHPSRRSRRRGSVGREAAGIVVANAPVSFGAFELTVGIDPNVPDASMVLDEVAGAGYEGIDLGRVGYFGERVSLAAALDSRGVTLCGGFFELPFSDPAAMAGAMSGLDALLDVFDSAPPRDGALK